MDEGFGVNFGIADGSPCSGFWLSNEEAICAGWVRGFEPYWAMACLTGMGSVKGGELEVGMDFFCGSGISAFIAMQTAMGFDFNEGGGRYSVEEMIDHE